MKTSTPLTLVPEVSEQATGCMGAGGYTQFAKKHGYTHIEVLDWSSSAGDWSFLVSKDSQEWRVLSQTNNYPRRGFSYEISDEVFYGNADEALESVEELYCY